ncbi:MAG: hypothetical protein M3Y56_11340 [Armatimonadota bacterium]|nr:hypothetical protein [Armatimonadota bacterium]
MKQSGFYGKITAAVLAALWMGASAAQAKVAVPREEVFASVRWNSQDAFRTILSRYGNPTAFIPGSGGAGGGGGGGGMSGGGSSGGSGGSGGGQTDTGDLGLVTWRYDNPGGMTGATLLITIDEQDAGAVKIIRLMSYRPTPWRTQQLVGIGTPFPFILGKYGFPDMTVPDGALATRVFYFEDNVSFKLYGKGRDMRVVEIQVGPGLEPSMIPPGNSGPNGQPLQR